MKRLLVGLFILSVVEGVGLVSTPAHAAVGTVTIDQSVAGSITAQNVTGVKFIDSANASYFLDPAATGNALILAGKVGIGTTSPSNLLDVLSTTSPQVRTSYDTSNYATTGVSSAGTVTMDAVGTTPGYYFPDRIGVGPNGTLNTNYDAYISNTNININNASANGALGIDATVAGTETGAGSNHYGIYRNLTFNGSAGGYSVSMLGDINYLINNVTTIGGNSSFTNHYNWLRNDAAVNFSSGWTNNYNESKNASTGTMTTMYNNNSTFVNSSTGVITNAYNYASGASNSSTGTISNLYGLYADSPVNASGTITSAYGVYVADQSVGTNTNAYGVYVADQNGAVTNNYGIYSAGTTNKNYFGGNVGIGSTAPGATLDVVGDIKLGSASTTRWRIYNTNQMSATNNCDTATTGLVDGLCFDSSDDAGTSEMRLQPSGDLTIAGAITQSGNPDIAEQIEVDDPTIAAGDVLVATTPLPEDGRDSYKGSLATKSHVAYQPSVIGVVSTDPGILIAIKNAMTLPGGNRSIDITRRSLAIAGRMPVNIAPDSERIKVGDYLTASNTPGRAMKAIHAGATLGKALEDWTPGSGKTSMLAFLNVSWYDPIDTAKVIKEQQDQIDNLSADNEALTHKVSDYDELKARLSKVEMMVNVGSSR